LQHSITQAGAKVDDMYDAMYLYGLWINYTLGHNGSIKDGRAWLEFAKNRSFPGNNLLNISWSQTNHVGN